MTTPRIRAIIVDDEPLGRQRLRDLLALDPDVELIGECEDGFRAVQAIRQHEPDLLFLDIQMPQMDGFAVLKKISPGKIPAVIFVTAYDEYAVRAFEVNALDYLLKPITRKRFLESLARIKERMQEGEGDMLQRTLAMLERWEAKSAYLQRLSVEENQKVRFLKVQDIDWLESEDNYVRVHTGKSDYLIRVPISRLAARLDPERFIRIHRKYLVNIDRISELAAWSRAAWIAILQDGTRLPVSRRLRDSVSRSLGKL